MKQMKKGFTLIELLVVIAIIAILAGVVLINVNQARQRARDAAVATGLSQLRSALEANYSPSTGYPTGTGTLSGAAYTNQVTNIETNAGGTAGLVYRGGNTTYIAYARLNDGEDRYHCIDSEGFSGTTAAPTGTATLCPPAIQ